jgi:stress response protein SCP2
MYDDVLAPKRFAHSSSARQFSSHEIDILFFELSADRDVSSDRSDVVTESRESDCGSISDESSRPGNRDSFHEQFTGELAY